MNNGKQNFINLPYKCLIPLVGKPELLKAFVIYGKLKLKFTYSAIHNIKSRKQEIAKFLNISENTFRKYLSILKANFMAWEDEEGTLRLAGRYSIYTSLKTEINYSENKQRLTDKRYRLYLKDLDREYIQLLALVHKKEQINYNNKLRIKNQLLKSFGNIQCPKIKRKIERNCSIKAMRIIDSNKLNFAESFKIGSTYGFTDDNMSGNSISKLIGRKSRITGNRLMHSLQKKNFITYDQRLIPICTLTSNTNISIISETSCLPIVLKTNNGVVSVCVRVPNSWTLI